MSFPIVNPWVLIVCDFCFPCIHHSRVLLDIFNNFFMGANNMDSVHSTLNVKLTHPWHVHFVKPRVVLSPK